MTLMMVATSALTALLFHLAPMWRVLCCAVLLYDVVLCVSLCHVSGVEQLYQAMRMIAGIGNVLFSTCSQTSNEQDLRVSFGEPLKHVITLRGPFIVSRKLAIRDDPNIRLRCEMTTSTIGIAWSKDPLPGSATAVSTSASQLQGTAPKSILCYRVLEHHVPEGLAGSFVRAWRRGWQTKVPFPEQGMKFRANRILLIRRLIANGKRRDRSNPRIGIAWHHER